MNTKQRWEMGCYGDGSLGHQHTRERCAFIMSITPRFRLTGMPLYDALRTDMSDDASEEIAATDWLNSYAAVEGASWGWQDGDFGLWPVEEE